MIGATITRYFGTTRKDIRDEQVRVECIAGVVTFRLEDGTLLEFDEVQLNGELFFAAHPDQAA